MRWLLPAATHLQPSAGVGAFTWVLNLIEYVLKANLFGLFVVSVFFLAKGLCHLVFNIFGCSRCIASHGMYWCQSSSEVCYKGQDLHPFSALCDQLNLYCISFRTNKTIELWFLFNGWLHLSVAMQFFMGFLATDALLCSQTILLPLCVLLCCHFIPP